jgi:HEAT repeat protein
MLQTLDDVVTSLAGLVVLLVLFLIAIRAAALRRARRARRFRPAAEASLGTYLAGSGAAPEIAGRGQRAILLAAARDALADLRGDERDRLVALLVQLGFAREAMLALSARRTVARRRAAETLATLATPLAVPAVTEALADRDVLVRTTCACTLAGTGGEAAVPAIMAVARRDAPAAPGAAASVVLALAQTLPVALAPLLAPGAPAAIRRIAVVLAADLRLAQFAGLLQASLADTDDLAADSARGLGSIGEFGAVATLAELAADSTRAPPVRAAAAGALGAIGDPSSLGLLEQLLLGAPDWSLRAAAAGALAQLGEPGCAALTRAAVAGPPEAAALAAAALDP